MMVDHPEHNTFLSDALRALVRELNANWRRVTKRGAATLAVYCAHGKRRSVCMAWHLSHALVEL